MRRFLPFALIAIATAVWIEWYVPSNPIHIALILSIYVLAIIAWKYRNDWP